MIPMKFLSKIGVYEIQIHGVTLKVRVVHAKDDSIVDIGISELRSQFGTTVNVGLIQPNRNSNYLQLCVGTRCSNDFLSDSDIRFVGVGDLSTNYNVCCKNYIKLSELGARVLKKPNSGSCSIGALANDGRINLRKEVVGVMLIGKPRPSLMKRLSVQLGKFVLVILVILLVTIFWAHFDLFKC